MGTISSGAILQGFVPNRIESVTNLTTSGILAIRVSAAVNYTINNTGVTATMPVGVTLISPSIKTINFSGATVIEVMDE